METSPPPTTGGISWILPSGLTQWIIFLIALAVSAVSAILLGLGYGSNISDTPGATVMKTIGIISMPIAVFVMIASSGIGRSIYSVLSEASLSGNIFPTLLILIISTVAFVAVFLPAFGVGGDGGMSGYGKAFWGLFGVMVLGILISVFYGYSERFQAASVISRLFSIFYAFLPYELMIFGPMSDILTQSIHFTPATIVGLTSIFINWIISTFLNKGVPVVYKNIMCEIPGLSYFSSNIVPQPMMASLSMLAYIATYISKFTASGGIEHPDISLAADSNLVWPVWTFYGVIYLVHCIVLKTNDCLDIKTAVSGAIIPIVYGGTFGWLASQFLKGSSASSAGGGPGLIGGGGGLERCPDGRPPGPNGECGQYTAPAVGTCAAGSNDGEFVCESFENGKLKRSVIIE